MLFTIETVKSQVHNAFLRVPGFDLPAYVLSGQ